MRCNIHHYCQVSPTAESPSQVRRPKAAACILRVETTMVFSPLSNECFCLESELGQADADSRGRAYTAAARERGGFWCRRLRHERTAAACNGIGCSGRLCSRSAGCQLSGHRGRAPRARTIAVCGRDRHAGSAGSRPRSLSLAESRSIRGRCGVCPHAKSLGRRLEKPDHRHLRLAGTLRGGVSSVMWPKLASWPAPVQWAALH
jgi:hypothetical protein